MNEKALPLSKENAVKKYIQADVTKIIEYINAEIEKQMNPYSYYPRVAVKESLEFKLADFKRVKPLYENNGWKVNIIEPNPSVRDGYMELT